MIVKTYQLPVENVDTDDRVNIGLWITITLGSMIMFIKGIKKEKNNKNGYYSLRYH